MKTSVALLLAAQATSAFSVVPVASAARPLAHPLASGRQARHAVFCSESKGGELSTTSGDDEIVEGQTRALTAAEVEEVGNLVEDDEWLGLTMELMIVLRCAIRESAKKSVKEFTGKSNYEVGDLSKELDARVKASVAELRGKDSYELGDLSIALDTIAKDEVKKLTGKDEYEFGDLSTEIDARVKAAVADYCGKETYTAGDLSKEVDKRIKERVNSFTGKSEYSFGDISMEIERRRVEWVQGYLQKSDCTHTPC